MSTISVEFPSVSVSHASCCQGRGRLYDPAARNRLVQQGPHRLDGRRRRGIAFTYNWSVLGEYRYTDYGRSTYIPPSFLSPFSERHHDTTHGMRVGVNFRF